jgi:hypothetical protein
MDLQERARNFLSLGLNPNEHQVITCLDDREVTSNAVWHCVWREGCFLGSFLMPCLAPLRREVFGPVLLPDLFLGRVFDLPSKVFLGHSCAERKVKRTCPGRGAFLLALMIRCTFDCAFGSYGAHQSCAWDFPVTVQLDPCLQSISVNHLDRDLTIMDWLPCAIAREDLCYLQRPEAALGSAGLLIDFRLDTCDFGFQPFRLTNCSIKLVE